MLNNRKGSHSVKTESVFCLNDVIASANTGLDAIKRAPIVDYDSGIRCLRIQDISQEKDFDNWGFCKVENKNLDKFQLKENDIIIARTGATIGVNRFIKSKLDAVYNNGLIRIRINEKVAYPKYIYYCMQSQKYRDFINSICAGTSTQPNMKINAFLDFKIFLPSIEIQRNIVNVLGAFDDKIENNNAINDNLEQQAQAIFTQELLSFDELPDNWIKGSLLDIADYLNGLAMQKFRPKDNEVGLPVLKIKELRQGVCDTSSEFCSPNIKPDYIIHDGDVIFSWSGSLLVDFWCGGICGLNQHLFKVSSQQYEKWFYYAWTNHHLQRFISIAADMATTMGHIKREELAKSEVLIPPNEDYHRIGSILSPIYELIIANRLENCKLVSMRDELLPKLMSGELGISEVSL